MRVAVSNRALEQIRNTIQSNVGKKVKLRANRGRRRVIEAEGIIENTYPKLFVIRLDQSSAVKRMSYTYVDVLTDTVELQIEGMDGEVVNL
ncbi:MAG: Veg protein [Firmicutes bacterium]|jgi:uncharacterized protein Veg|nr:Veg protein [Bacillota bacterium]